jgi:hypothetical protein
MGAIRFLQYLRAALVTLIFVAGSMPGLAKEGRIALVVGNSAYANVTPLKNAVADADAVARNLTGLGFDVIKATNATRGQMNEAIGHFLDKAGPDTDALIYFAGHGVELAGANYLLPVDVPGLRPGQERLLRVESVSLTDLLQELEGRRSRVSIVVLDACRDNPFPPQGTRSLGSTRGLARVDPPSGAFVVFSAGAGEQALDVLGPNDENPNGVFTRRFLALMNEPGVELRQMVLKLRTEVSGLARGVNHRQMPSYYDQMSGSFYFRQPGAAQASLAPAASPPTTEPAQPAAPRRGHIRFNVSRLYSAPQFDGKPLDWCKTWLKDCGYPAADAFCKAHGHPGARLIQRQQATETKLIGEDRSCSGTNCSAFRFIHCLMPDVNFQIQPGIEVLLNERWSIDANCNVLPGLTATIDRKPDHGGVEVRSGLSRVFGVSGAFTKCTGLERESVRIVYKAPVGFSGPVRIDYRSRVPGQTDHLGRSEFEIIKPATP